MLVTLTIKRYWIELSKHAWNCTSFQRYLVVYILTSAVRSTSRKSRYLCAALAILNTSDCRLCIFLPETYVHQHKVPTMEHAHTKIRGDKLAFNPSDCFLSRITCRTGDEKDRYGKCTCGQQSTPDNLIWLPVNDTQGFAILPTSWRTIKE